MIETKVRLSLSVPGAGMLTQGECDKNPDKSYNTDVIIIEYPIKKKKIHKEKLAIKTRKNRVVKQVINITKEAYNYMTNASNPPTDKLAKHIYVKEAIGKSSNNKPITKVIETTIWAHNYTPMQRLNWHMSRIAEGLGAISYTFEVFDD